MSSEFQLPMNDLEQDKLTDDVVIDRMVKYVLTPWMTLQHRLQELRPQNDYDRAVQRKLLQYVETRRQGFELFIDGVSHNNEKEFSRALEVLELANKMAIEMAPEVNSGQTTTQ